MHKLYMKTEIIIGMFLIGLLFCSSYKHSDVVETFESGANQCPNVLIQKGDKLLLLNTKKAKVPGINPIYFNNLEEYTEFVQWQQAMKIKCPILYFQQTYTTQGEKGFRMLPDPVEKQAGLPSSHVAQRQPLYDAGHDDPPYNKNSYPGADPEDQNIGVYTPLDKIYHSRKMPSDSAMDTNWGGVGATMQSIDQGVYDGDFRRSLGVGADDSQSMADLTKEDIRKGNERIRKKDFGSIRVGSHEITGSPSKISRKAEQGRELLMQDHNKHRPAHNGYHNRHEKQRPAHNGHHNRDVGLTAAAPPRH